GDAAVGRLQRRAVIDAVAQEAHHMVFLVQGGDYARLLGRRNLGKHRRGLCGLRERLVAHGFDFGPEHDPSGLQTDVMTDLAGDKIVVTRENLDRYPHAVEFGYGRTGTLLWGIQKRDEAH